ncbi:hypothetical protein [Flavihumibacter solisilvae]|uniref:Uncharacterized protein n=1 Tax=Flavihumibacter solisilvae TaxID=1349421 RepID=A0A0C1KZ03_9BACT|nr:hypothetical protein [Flavihumibacter solisilvae]KIC92922.1 hypothetical protein OI18_20180 [Flavihumibacter solisilvae]
MEKLLDIGQWQGFFIYGAEYGNIVEGHEAEFRLFIEEFEDDQFTGRVIDWESLGANGEVAAIKGFLNDDFISFTKQYSQFHTIDEWGNCEAHSDVSGHQVFYEGRYNRETNSCIGTWEIIYEIEHGPDYTIEQFTSGT